mmetsp:Transcript_9723/g.11787  ORF Transcript_9723/g.11787 Transcript_9723/m.11787 type:complete len:103 (+) Transcript_9723:92-400(+)
MKSQNQLPWIKPKLQLPWINPKRRKLKRSNQMSARFLLMPPQRSQVMVRVLVELQKGVAGSRFPNGHDHVPHVTQHVLVLAIIRDPSSGDRPKPSSAFNVSM